MIKRGSYVRHFYDNQWHYGEVTIIREYDSTAKVLFDTLNYDYYPISELEEMIPGSTKMQHDEAVDENKLVLKLELNEVKALNRIFYHDYISYKDEAAMAVATKVYRWLADRGQLEDRK